MAKATILTERRQQVGWIQLNRPEALNALNAQMMKELRAALEQFDADLSIGAIVIIGDKKAFAAGADIKEMMSKTATQLYTEQFISRDWEAVSKTCKPVIAAVSGYALGGGCELAMMCDVIVAAENAKFGQPEVTLGTLPGIGGTQRLTALIGKAKAMEMCLTGRLMDSFEAERSGLVSQLVPDDQLEQKAFELAVKIGSFSQPIVAMIKQSINASQEQALSQGIATERQLFYSSFATHDQKEGMRAFVEKRPPKWENR